MCLSGGDDNQLNLYDLRQRKPSHIHCENSQILAAVFDEDANHIIYAGIDHSIKLFDLRKKAVSLQLDGLCDSVTALSLSPNGNFILSNSMDNLCKFGFISDISGFNSKLSFEISNVHKLIQTLLLSNPVCIFDIRPYAPANRLVQTLQGHAHNYERNLLRCCWSKDGNYVSAGSADRFVYIWSANDGRIVYKLSGHLGSVNEVAFHPKEPIVLSCSNDKQIYLGELEL